MRNSTDIINHSNMPELGNTERFSSIRMSTIARLVQIGALVLCTAGNSYASSSQRPIDSRIGNGPISAKKDAVMANNSEIPTDVLTKSDQSTAKMIEINSDNEMPLLIDFIKSIGNPDITAGMSSDFINIAKKYGADWSLVESILKKKVRSENDNVALVTEARHIVQSWSGSVEEHCQNLAALSKYEKDKSPNSETNTRLGKFRGMAKQLTNYTHFLSGLLGESN